MPEEKIENKNIDKPDKLKWYCECKCDDGSYHRGEGSREAILLYAIQWMADTGFLRRTAEYGPIYPKTEKVK